MIRIIPRMDIKGPNLVKGIKFEGLRVLGHPEYFAGEYFKQGADELIYMDTVASLYGRNNLKEIVENTARQIFIPLTVGGGIRTIDDIRTLLRAGADKVAINTAAIKDPELIREGSKAFGSQCIVVSIEAKKKTGGVYEAMIENGREETNVDAFKWAQLAEKLGAGELLVTSIDRDGTGEGYDIELISNISKMVSIPMIASGGAGCIDHMKALINETSAGAVSAASVFHYHHINEQLSTKRFKEGNIDFLMRVSKVKEDRFKRIIPLSIGEVKSQLKERDRISIKSNVSHFQVDFRDPVYPCTAESSDGTRHKPLIVVVDYGCGNLFSIGHSLDEIGARYLISGNPEELKKADRLFLPGVGSFGEGMKNLRQRGLSEVIRLHASRGKPILGICLGMQLLMTTGEEFGVHEGLDIISGKVIKLKMGENQLSKFKIPHIGWNNILSPSAASKTENWEKTILADLNTTSTMYFNHSYIVEPDNPEDILATTRYGDRLFCSVIRKNNIYGCQFHPEKSGALGLCVYRRFAKSQIKIGSNSKV